MEAKTLTIVQKYSSALVEVAVEEAKTESIFSETMALLTVFEKTNLSDFLAIFDLPQVEQKKVVELLQEGSSPEMSNFLEVILKNSRVNLLRAILADASDQFKKITKEFDVVVTAATALTDEQKQRISDIVEKKFAIKTNAIIEDRDPSIIGGFVIKANNKVIDASIKTQLQQIKSNIN